MTSIEPSGQPSDELNGSGSSLFRYASASASRSATDGCRWYSQRVKADGRSSTRWRAPRRRIALLNASAPPVSASANASARRSCRRDCACRSGVGSSQTTPATSVRNGSAARSSRGPPRPSRRASSASARSAAKSAIARTARVDRERPPEIAMRVVRQLVRDHDGDSRRRSSRAAARRTRNTRRDAPGAGDERRGLHGSSRPIRRCRRPARRARRASAISRAARSARRAAGRAQAREEPRRAVERRHQRAASSTAADRPTTGAGDPAPTNVERRARDERGRQRDERRRAPAPRARPRPRSTRLANRRVHREPEIQGGRQRGQLPATTSRTRTMTNASAARDLRKPGTDPAPVASHRASGVRPRARASRARRHPAVSRGGGSVGSERLGSFIAGQARLKPGPQLASEQRWTAWLWSRHAARGFEALGSGLSLRRPASSLESRASAASCAQFSWTEISFDTPGSSIVTP